MRNLVVDCQTRPWFSVANFTVATPLPGTELYREAVAQHPEIADRRGDP